MQNSKMTDTRGTAIIILGMHRSGTSALAGALNEAGCTLPKFPLEPNAFNEKGYFEAKHICWINEAILKSVGSSWRDWKTFPSEWRYSPDGVAYLEKARYYVEAEFPSGGLFVVKDPRMCRLVPFWLDVFETFASRTVVIFPFRHPAEVAASIAARDGFDKSYGLLMWLRNVLDSEFGSRGTGRFFCSFEALISDSADLIKRAGIALGIDWPKSQTGFVTGELRHFRRAQTETELMPDLVLRVYEVLERWAVEGEDAAGREVFDDVRTQFNSAETLFAPLVSTVRTANSLN